MKEEFSLRLRIVTIALLLPITGLGLSFIGPMVELPRVQGLVLWAVLMCLAIHWLFFPLLAEYVKPSVIYALEIVMVLIGLVLVFAPESVSGLLHLL